MRSMNVRDVAPDAKLGRAVISPKGQVLLNEGTELTASHLQKLKSWGVSYIYVEMNSNSQSTKNRKSLAESKINASNLSPNLKKFPEEYTTTVKEMKEMFDSSELVDVVPLNCIRDLIDHTINDIVRTVWALHYLHELRQRSDSTFAHSVNVSALAGTLGTWLNYSLEERKKLILTGLLHDLGKLFLPVNILEKPSRLSVMEFEVIKKHSQDGYQLLKYSDQVPREVKLGILQHHERLDGSGYPFNLKGNEIHRFAKIIAVADMYDAMTSEKVYRQKRTPLEAFEVINTESSNKLDPGICSIFLTNMPGFFNYLERNKNF